MACRHEAALGRVLAPSASSRVHKNECTLCFSGPGDAGGLDVCLQCFNGACARHSPLHVAKTGHCLVLHLSAPAAGSASEDHSGGEPSAKSPRVCGVPADSAPAYSVQCAVCYEQVDLSGRPSLAAVAAEIACETPAARERHELDAQHAAGGPLAACEHVLRDPNAGASTAPGTPRCGECGATDNLWLCLACGAVGCGRAQYDGTGGRGHGAAHATATGHAAAVKLGTVSADMSSADVHCYACDDMRLAPRLAAQLTALGAASSARDAPREATMAEMQLAQNMSLDLRGPCGGLDTDGKPMAAVDPRPGARGLVNLGNTCYMSSVLQALLPLAPLAASFGRAAFEAHASVCTRDSASCVACQAGKLRCALFDDCSPGVRVGPGDDDGAVAPWMFRRAVSSGHAEFSGSRQQDAAEYLSHLWRALRRAGEAAAVAPFAFDVGQRVECGACSQVLGRTVARDTTELSLHAFGRDDSAADSVAMAEMLDREFGAAEIEACGGAGSCPTCGSASRVSRSGLLSVPRFLVVSVSRVALTGWVPTKRDVAVSGACNVDLTPYVIPADERAAYDAPAVCPASALPAVDDLVLAELESMGFPAERARRALLSTGGTDLEAAANWLFEHMDDASPENSGRGAEDTSVAMLCEAGFGRDAAADALRACGGDVERALDRLLSHSGHLPSAPGPAPEEGGPPDSGEIRAAHYALRAFVAHSGASMHCGHYVAYVREPAEPAERDRPLWHCFNDTRVMATRSPDVGAAYIYVYERVA